MMRLASRVLFTLLALQVAEPWAAGLRSPGIAPLALSERIAGPRPPLVVDVRAPDEFSAGHVPGAVNVPVPLVKTQLGRLGSAESLIVYCNDSRFTRLAEQILVANGIDGFSHLEGGLTAWEQQGLRVEQSLP